MSESYEIDLIFDKESMSDSEFDQFLEEVEQIGEDIEVKSRRDDQQLAQLSEPATVIALNAALLAVNGTDLLVTLYRMARTHSSFTYASITDENGEDIEALSKDHIEAGSIQDSVIIDSVEGGVNIDGDVYFVRGSDVDWMDIAQGSVEEEKEED